MRDFLDVDAAFGGYHKRHTGGFAIDQDRQIELLVDLGAFLDIEAIDLLAGRAGLFGDQRRAQHLLDELVDVVGGLGDAHAALVAGGGFLEFALAAPPGVDLALHHPDRTTKFVGGEVGVGRLEDGDSARHRHAEFPQQRLGLVFMDVHLDVPPTLMRRI